MNTTTLTITDPETGLMWEVFDEKQQNWYQCRHWLKEFNRMKYAGFSDWRIPTLAELTNLPRLFPDIKKGRALAEICFWSSTRCPGVGYAYCMDFSHDEAQEMNSQASILVCFVRGKSKIKQTYKVPKRGGALYLS